VSIVVGVSMDGVRVPLSRDDVSRVVQSVLRAEGVADAMLSVTFVTTSGIRQLNRTHLRRSGPTDVISFGFRRAHRRAPLIGDVYIAPDVARESAKANGVTIREELVRLVVHGVLHALGHDHPEGATRTSSPMWRKQERLVRRLARSVA
jgi:probable rRNA maturation factor